jgi:hypothetical protein
MTQHILQYSALNEPLYIRYRRQLTQNKLPTPSIVIDWGDLVQIVGIAQESEAAVPAFWPELSIIFYYC